MLFMASLLTIAFSACNKDNNESNGDNNTQSWIVGKWQEVGWQESEESDIIDFHSVEHFYTFNSNGTVIEQQRNEDSYNLNYRISGSKMFLYMVDEDGEEEGFYVIIRSHDDKSMVWKGAENTNNSISYLEKI